MIFSALDGEPLAVIEDRAWITQLRTAAAGAVAAEALARPDAETLAIFGSGPRRGCRPTPSSTSAPAIREVLVWGRTPEHVRRFAEGLRASRPDLTVEAKSHAEEVARPADIVVTATYANEPIVRGEWLPEGVLVIGMGADSIHKRELDPGDPAPGRQGLRRQPLAEPDPGRGRPRHPRGLFDAHRIDAEIGDVLIAADQGQPGRTSDRERIVCKLTGVAVQEIFVCDYVLRAFGVVARDPLMAGITSSSVS